MNLRDLHYLVAVADHLHFGNAARACHISQPTLSMQLKKLEDYLGVTLLERGRKQVVVTAAGERIVTLAREMVRTGNAIRELAKTAQDPFSGELRLGAFPTLAPYMLPVCVPAIHRALPKLTLLLSEEKTDALIGQLKKGTLDAAFLALPVDDPALECTALFSDPFMLAVHAAHPLAKRRTVELADIRREPLLLLEEGHCLRAQALAVCSIIGAPEQRAFRATSLETLRHMVAAKVGITLIPRMAMMDNDGIAYIPFKDKTIARTVGIVWRKGAAREAAVARVAEIVGKTMKHYA